MFSLFAGSVLHYSALDIGKVFLVAGTVSLVVMPVMGRLSPKVDGRILLSIGVVVVASSQLVASHLTQAAGFWDLVKRARGRALSRALQRSVTSSSAVVGWIATVRSRSDFLAPIFSATAKP